MEGVRDNAGPFIRKLIMRSKHRGNIEKWVLRKLMSLMFQMKKLKNLRAGEVKAWLM